MAAFRRFYANAQLPLWWRVVLFAVDHDGVPLQQRQLRDAVDPERTVRSAEVSRAIHRGVTARMLAADSNALCLRLAVSDQEAA